MLKVVESDSRPFLLYCECGSKNNGGGLNHRKVKNKMVKAFSNVQNPNRCVVMLYQKYMALRPHDAPSDAFYLQPLRNPCENC